jgi:hypothetical protein
MSNVSVNQADSSKGMPINTVWSTIEVVNVRFRDGAPSRFAERNESEKSV